MSLANYYRQQFEWRDWTRILAALPPLQGQLVLDFGCGIGDQAAELVARGARVIGLDMNAEVIEAARAMSLAHAEFVQCDLAALPDLGVAADGLWSSFTAAYFVELAPVLATWAQHLRPGAWIALTEIDDFFAHEPLEARTKACFDAYVRDAFAARRYDFQMGRKLAGYLAQAGFDVAQNFVVADQELAFDGPALPAVVEAWRTRLAGMQLLRDSCGADFAALRDDFLACLSRADHRSLATVRCCLGVKR